MAAATNDLNKIIKDTAIQLPQCLQMVDQVVKVLDKAGSYDTKKMKANIKNFKKVMGVIEDYNQAVTEMMGKLGKKSIKGRIVDMVKTLITKDPTAVTGEEKNPYESGFELFDKTANILFTIQKILDGLVDMAEGKRGSLLKSSRKLRKLKKVFINAIDLVFEIITEVDKKLASTTIKNAQKFDLEAFEKMIGVFEKLHKFMKIALSITPLMILFIFASPIFLIGLSIMVLILNATLFVLGCISDKQLKRAQKDISKLSRVFQLLAIIMLEIIVLALVIPFVLKYAGTLVIGLIQLSLYLLAMMFTLWVLTKLIQTFKIIKSIVYIILVLVLVEILCIELVAMALSLWIIQAIASRIDWEAVFQFVLMSIILIVIFTALGWVATICAPVLVPAMIAMILVVAAITLIVGLLLITALMLWVLQFLTLDKDKIITNVQTVIDTALAVINAIFTDPEEKDDAEGKSWWKTLLSKMGRGIQLVLEAILAVAFIALTFVAITLILLIAAELRLLQILDLNPTKIHENCKLVIDTAMMVVNLVLYNSEEAPEDAEGKPWYKKLFEFIGGRLFQLLEVIFAVAFLALALVAITLILVMAAELRVLQIIDLNPEKIRQNCKLVIDTAQMVIDSIFAPDEKEEDPSRKGFFHIILEFLGGSDILKILEAIMAVAYLALIMVSILLIMFIAKTLKYIQELILDPDKITTNVGIVIDTAQMVISSIFDSTDDKEEDPSQKGFFRTLMEWLGLGTLLQIIDAVMAIAYLALIMVSIYIIKYIAETLEYIANLQIDESTIKKNVKSVIAAAKVVIDCVFQKDNTKPEPGKDIFRKLLKMILPTRFLQFLDAIMAIGYLSLVKTCVGLVGEMAINLTAINNLPSMSGIKGKVQIIVNTSRSVINAVLYGDKPGRKEMESLAKKAERAEDYLRAIQRVPSLLNKVVDGFNELKTLQDSAEKNALRTIDSLCKIVNQFNKMDTGSIFKAYQSNKVFDAILNIMRRLSWMSINDTKAKTVDYILYTFAKFGNSVTRMNIQDSTIQGMHGAFEEVIEFTRFVLRNKFYFKMIMPMIEGILHIYGKFFRSIGYMNINTDKVGSMQSVFKTITDFNASMTDENISKSATMLQNYDTFLTRIDTLKIENLQTAAKIFEEMARFSESISGNFDALAETLNERIAPLMEELKNTLDQVNNKVVDKEKTGQSTYEQVKESMMNSGQLAGLSTAGAEQAVKQRMAEENREIMGVGDISDKLSELIRLFNEGTAKVQPVS